jgi:ketosteroid isomerase-like protein
MTSTQAPDGTALQARMQRLDAVDAIRELPARYAAAYARLDLDALVELYVPQVRLHTGAVGRDELRAHFERSVRGTRTGGGLHIVILHNGNHVIDFEGPDSARGIVYCHGDMQLTDGTRYTQAIIYTDTYARLGDRWYFAAQRVHELVYGAPPLTRPNALPDANWPASQTGRGTLPGRWPSWKAFWDEPRSTGSTDE